MYSMYVVNLADYSVFGSNDADDVAKYLNDEVIVIFPQHDTFQVGEAGETETVETLDVSDLSDPNDEEEEEEEEPAPPIDLDDDADEQEG